MNKIKATMLAILAFMVPLITQAKPTPSIKFSECFLKYNTMNGETEIILYNLRFTKQTKMSEERFKEMFELSEFEIKDIAYDSLEKPTSIRVLAQTKNFMRNTPVQQLFSNMLGVKAEVSLGGNGPMGMTMSVLIPMQKNMYVADNNTLQVLHNEKEKNALLEFDLSDFPSKPLEVVIGWKEKETLTEKMDKEYQLILDNSLKDEPTGVLSAWMVYGGSRLAWRDGKFQEKYPNAKRYQFTYEEELESRTAMITVWKELKSKDSNLEDIYLDDLIKIEENGFLKEYVWQSNRSEGWKKTVELKLEDFKIWGRKNILKHKPQNRAEIK